MIGNSPYWVLRFVFADFYYKESKLIVDVDLLIVVVPKKMWLHEVAKRAGKKFNLTGLMSLEIAFFIICTR